MAELGCCQSSASNRYGREKKHLFPNLWLPSGKAHTGLTPLMSVPSRRRMDAQVLRGQRIQHHHAAVSLHKRHGLSSVSSAEQRVCGSPSCWLLPHFISWVLVRASKSCPIPGLQDKPHSNPLLTPDLRGTWSPSFVPMIFTLGSQFRYM